MARQLTSLRLSVDALARLDAWADHLAHTQGLPRSRTFVIERLLDRAGDPPARVPGLVDPRFPERMKKK